MSITGGLGNMFRGGGQVIHRDDNADANREQQRNSGNGDGVGAGDVDDDEEEEESEHKVFQDLFSEDEDEDSEDDEDDDDEEEEESRKKKKKKTPRGDDDGTPEERVAAEVQTMLKNMRIPEDVIPEDFNPSDPKQFRDVVGKIQQHTAMATMQMAFKPMQAAMEQLARSLRTEIQSAIRQHGEGSSARQILESIVPEATDPELNGLVNTLFTQARKKSKNSQAAAQQVRKALDAMGIKKKKGGSGRADPSSEDSEVYREGRGALDLYAPVNRR